MLKIFNDLQPFFEDNYRRISVREYARIRKISPPASSSLLQSLKKEGLLNTAEERNYIYYWANKESSLFIGLSRAYWRERLAGPIAHLQQELLNPVIVLFGSFSKAEVNPNSDTDLAIFTASKKKINLSEFEKKFKRKFQVFVFKDQKTVSSKELLNNIHNGFILSGRW